MNLHTGDRQATKAWCRQRRDVYARRLSLAKAPRIMWSMEAWDAAVPKVDRVLKAGDRGCASAAANVIYVNIAAQLCRHDMDDTIAHEAVHLRWPSLWHTKAFDVRLAAVKRGVRFGPHGSALPAL